MAVPLTVSLRTVADWWLFIIPVARGIPCGQGITPAHWVEYVSIAVPLVGVLLAYLIFHSRQLKVDGLVNSQVGKQCSSFGLVAGVSIGSMIDFLFGPIISYPECLKSEPVDALYGLDSGH